MKNLLRLTVLSVVLAMITVSCVPYEILRGEYRDATFYNKTPGPVDIEYQVIGSTYSAPNRINAGYNEKIKVYTVDGKATLAAEGPYVSYKWSGESISYDGTSVFYVSPNRGFIRIINNTGIDIMDVSLGTISNPKKYKATFNLTKNADTVSADIASARDAGIRVMSSDIASSLTTSYYIYFTYKNTRYRTRASIELPLIGKNSTAELTLEECVMLR